MVLGPENDHLLPQALLEGPAAEGRALAGTEVRVALDMRDRFGNVSASRSEQHVSVEATGACTVPFEEYTTDSFRCGSRLRRN